VDADDEIDRLYGLPLEEFVRGRQKAAREAREAGDRTAAETIDTLRKPTIAAWAVNQLCRRGRRDVDLLLDAGHRLLAAQRASLAGDDRDELDRARRDEDATVARLRKAGEALLGHRASEATLDRVEGTLRAAAISPEGRELLARGRFTREATATGWDVFEALAADMPARKASRPAKSERPPAQPDLERARHALRQAENRRREAARTLQDAERAQEGAKQALQAADERVERARDDLDEADKALAKAKRELRKRL
jgi:hypothetical protein